MLIAFFCALTLFQQRTGRTTRVFCLATMLTAVVAAATTFVRSTWIGMASGLVAYLLLRWVRHPLLRWAVVAVLVPMIYVASTQMARDERARRPQAADSASQVVQMRAQSVFTARPETDLLGRYLGLQAALRTAAAGPFGFGLGSTSAERFGGGPVAWSGDSQITTLLAELGWPGLLCFVAILVLVVRCNVKAIDAAGSPDLRTLLVGMAGIQIGLIVTSLTGGPLWYSQPTCLYAWLLAGVTVNAAEGQRSALGSRRSARQGNGPAVVGPRAESREPRAGAKRPCTS
jgi:uncharacterized membrane protein